MLKGNRQVIVPQIVPTNKDQFQQCSPEWEVTLLNQKLLILEITLYIRLVKCLANQSPFLVEPYVLFIGIERGIEWR